MEGLGYNIEIADSVYQTSTMSIRRAHAKALNKGSRELLIPSDFSVIAYANAPKLMKRLNC